MLLALVGSTALNAVLLLLLFPGSSRRIVRFLDLTYMNARNTRILITGLVRYEDDPFRRGGRGEEVLAVEGRVYAAYLPLYLFGLRALQATTSREERVLVVPARREDEVKVGAVLGVRSCHIRGAWPGRVMDNVV